jgi:PAS domain S-box-containing protein
VQNKAGDRFPAHISNSPIVDSNGKLTGIVGVSVDITERSRAEKALREAEDKYRTLVESSPAIVYLAEPHPPFSTIYVSPNVTRFGYTIQEWFDRPEMWLTLIHPEDQARVLRATEEAVERGLETDLEYRIIAQDGTISWIHDKGRFVVDEQGNKVGWQGVMVDISRTKELEEQLRQSQKLESVGLLAGGIAHDFNNMLTAINGYSDLTLRRLNKTDPLRHNIEEIKKAGQRSADLTQQLLAFSRQQILQPIVLDLNDVISDTIKILQRVIGEDIQLTTTLTSKIGRVKVDPGQFSQIVMNLAVNARDAMPQGGKLTIETANVSLDPDYTRHHVGILPGAYVLLAISDTGIGMSEETQKHIFEPFFTNKEVGQGTGLGLATVYGIVKQSGGSIEVYSEVGVGTTFKIYLPRVAEQPTAEKIKDIPAAMPKGTETILLVEDEDVVRHLSRQVLEECGYTVIEARDGLEALKICEQRDYKFDLLMTDVVMPQMGGRELSEILKAKLPGLRILFTSGYTDDAIMRHGVIETNSNFIQKPFTPETLAHKVREILDNS